MTVGAVVVDTDCPGYFRETDRDSLEFSLREFAFRIKLETLLNAIFVPPGENHETSRLAEEVQSEGCEGPSD